MAQGIKEGVAEKERYQQDEQSEPSTVNSYMSSILSSPTDAKMFSWRQCQATSC